MARSSNLLIGAAALGAAYYAYTLTRGPEDLGPEAPGFSWNKNDKTVRTIAENALVGNAETRVAAIDVAKGWFGKPAKAPVGTGNAGNGSGDSLPGGSTVDNPLVDLGAYGQPGFAWNRGTNAVIVISDGTVIATAISPEDAVRVVDRDWWGNRSGGGGGGLNGSGDR